MKKNTLSLQPAIITIFGITGDLARRKLLPSLYHLAHDGLLAAEVKIVGVTRRGTTVDDVIASIVKSVENESGETCDIKTIQWLRASISIVTMDITDENDYNHLKFELDAIETKIGLCLTRVFYLAIPSTMFEPVVDRLGKTGLNTGCEHRTADSRLLIEKPFGYDMASAKDLIARLQESFSEDQIYRIDHYLAKETVQNILTFRFENPLFAHAWDAKNVSHILVTAAESIGIEGRAAFYEQMGAMRDLIQSHLLQLVALVTMERPQVMNSQHIHEQKEAILRAIQPPLADEMDTKTVRGQYEGYLSEIERSHSTTETFAAVELSIDTDKWRGVPVLVRTGKALANKVTEITIVYTDETKSNCRNTLTLRLQPNEGIVLDLRIKKPGYDDAIEHVQMDFCYDEKMKASLPDAYERVLVDALRGDKTLFATSDEVLESWRISEPIIETWARGDVDLEQYKKGSWGPQKAEKLARQAGIDWLTDTLHICQIHDLKHRSGKPD